MAQDGHRELAGRPVERRSKPLGLGGVDRSQDAGVDGDEREPIRLDLEEGRALKPGRHAVHRPEPLGLANEAVDAVLGRAREAQVGLDSRANARARGVGLEERRGEPLERVVPVMIAGDGVDRPRDALERQPELRFVVVHRSRRVHDVRRDDDESHVGVIRHGEDLIAKDVLGGVALARIADDDEREVAGADTWRLHGERVERASRSRTIASRQVSVRDSAQEFHIPAAQFSVSKYQLMPQTGTVAATMAAIGSPVWRPRPSAFGTE